MISNPSAPIEAMDQKSVSNLMVLPLFKAGFAILVTTVYYGRLER